MKILIRYAELTRAYRADLACIVGLMTLLRGCELHADAPLALEAFRRDSSTRPRGHVHEPSRDTPLRSSGGASARGCCRRPTRPSRTARCSRLTRRWSLAQSLVSVASVRRGAVFGRRCDAVGRAARKQAAARGGPRHLQRVEPLARARGAEDVWPRARPRLYAERRCGGRRLAARGGPRSRRESERQPRGSRDRAAVGRGPLISLPSGLLLAPNATREQDLISELYEAGRARPRRTE